MRKKQGWNLVGRRPVEAIIANTTHGCGRTGKKTPSYITWDKMMQRCYNENDTNYPDYGGKGVLVCARWKTFVNFLNDMGERRTNQTLHRKEDAKEYNKENCCWLTKSEHGTISSLKRWRENGRSNCISA